MRIGMLLSIALTASLTIGGVSSYASQTKLSEGELKSLQQRPLVAAAEVLRAEAVKHSGFGGITLADHHVNLWWKGDVPPAISGIVRRTPVRVGTAAHSQLELTAAAKSSKRGVRRIPNPGFMA